MKMAESGECKTSAHGACGRIVGLPGTLYVYCTRKGIPDARVGHDGFEKEIPTLNMADPAYNPDAVAAFFLALVAHDVREHNDGD